MANGRYIVKKKYGYNALFGQRYTKSWRIIDTQTGKTVRSGNRDNLGSISGIIRDLEAQNKIEDQQLEQKSDIDEKQAEYETLIKEGGAELKELAETKAARQGGFMAQQMKNALLASGQDPTMIQAISDRGSAATERGLQDVLRGVQAQTTQQLAGAKQFNLETDLGQQRLQDAMTQFIQNQQLERDRIQASIDMQPEWWESALGSFAGGLGQMAGTYLTGGMGGGLQGLMNNLRYGLSDPSQPYITYGNSP